MIDYKEFKRLSESAIQDNEILDEAAWTKKAGKNKDCLLYTSDAADD